MPNRAHELLTMLEDITGQLSDADAAHVAHVTDQTNALLTTQPTMRGGVAAKAGVEFFVKALDETLKSREDGREFVLKTWLEAQSDLEIALALRNLDHTQLMIRTMISSLAGELSRRFPLPDPTAD